MVAELLNKFKQERLHIKQEDDKLINNYKEAKRNWEIAMSNFENANPDYREIAILELNVKKAKLDKIIREIKEKNLFTI